MDVSELRSLWLNGVPTFWDRLAALIREDNRAFAELFLLSAWRKMAQARKLTSAGKASNRSFGVVTMSIR